MRESFDFENAQLLENYFETGTAPKQQDMIKWAKSYLSRKSPRQRLDAAVKHLFDALSYRSPRVDLQSNASSSMCSDMLSAIYNFQTSLKWRFFLTVLSYIFMCLVLVDYLQPKTTQVCIEWTILALFWVDILLQTSYRSLSEQKYVGFESTRYNIKIVLILLITLDEVLAVCHHEFRLLVILRAGLPLLWDTSLRKKMVCVGLLYKDCLVYMFIFGVVVFFFAVAVNQFMRPAEQGQEYDQLTQDYGLVGKAMLLFYVMSSYDSYPDNQLFVIKNQPGIYAIFILFIFLNVIIFQVVPTSLLYKQFSNEYAKCILLDEIRQQHSLIFAFVALSDDQMMLPFSRFISFMFAVYGNRSQYVGYITQISLRLNHHQTDNIHICQFMQLCKIIQSQQQMIPSNLPVLQAWTTFRNAINLKFGLKQLALSIDFQIVVSTLVLLSIINCIFLFYNESHVFNVIDKIFIVVFCLEMVIKIIGLGVYNFFNNFLNFFDFLVVVLMVALEIFDIEGIPPHSAGLTNILRFHRVPLLAKLLASKYKLIQHSSLYLKWARLANHLIVTFPTVFQFMPIFLIVSYFLGVAGMFIFRHPPAMPPEQSDYSRYDDFSNFRQLIFTQFYYVQILVEAGWSAVLFDYIYRYGYTFFIVMYFIVCHLAIVVVLTPLFRGITWAFYETINNQSNNRALSHVQQHLKLDKLQHEMRDLKNIENLIKQNKAFQPISICSRRVIEGRLSQLLIEKVKQQRRKFNEKSTTFQESNFPIMVDEIDELNLSLQIESRKSSILIQSLIENCSIEGIESLQQQDIDREIQRLSATLSSNPDLLLEQQQCPDVLARFLKKKLSIVSVSNIYPEQFNQESHEHTEHILNQMRCMLKITNTYTKNLFRNLKQVLIQNEVSVNYLEPNRVNNIDQIVLNHNTILRKSFMRGCSEALIKKVQLEYFTQIYPNHFRQMFENVGLESLLLQDSRVTYGLRSILRYPTIQMKDFFNFLISIENTISSKLFKEGSLFKFMFELQERHWFFIQMKPLRELKVHFLKNHVWIFEKEMNSDQIYYAQDIFKSDQVEQLNNSKILHSTLKMLFHNFQSIAINSKIRDHFFRVNPSEYIKDLYLTYKKVPMTETSTLKKYKISKVMAFVLSKQRERSELLPYDLSKIETDTHWSPERPLNFELDESQTDTYEKIRKMQTVDDQIIKNEKRLSHPFTINLMAEIGDILETDMNNLLMQVEKLLTIQLS